MTIDSGPEFPDFLRPNRYTRIGLRLAQIGDDEPIYLNYGYGERVFGVTAALAWAERLADEELDA